MIRVHLGVDKLPTTISAETVRQPQDYIGARLAIRHAMQAKTDLDVFVLTSVCKTWFWDLDGLPDVRIRNEDPVALLCRKLQVPSLPAEIADTEVITSLQLLELPNSNDPTMDILAWVAKYKLGEVWSVDLPSSTHFGQLVGWLACNRVPRILEPLARKRMQVWLARATGPILEGYRVLRKDPDRLVPFVCCWRALNVYDEELRIRWLDEEGWYIRELRSLASSLNELPMPSTAQKIISQKAEAYWRRSLKELDQETVA